MQSNFIGDEICATHAILACGVFLTGTGEGIKILDHFGALKPCFGECREIACRLQSTRDSPDPELDIVERCRRQLGFDHDVGKLNPAALAQYAVEFGEDSRLFRAEIDYAV